MGKSKNSGTKDTTGKQDRGRPKKKSPQTDQCNFDQVLEPPSSDDEEETHILMPIESASKVPAPIAILSKILTPIASSSKVPTPIARSSKIPTPGAALSNVHETQPTKRNLEPARTKAAKWGDRMGTELFQNGEKSKLKVTQHPAFTLTFDSTVLEADEIILLDEEIGEGLG